MICDSISLDTVCSVQCRYRDARGTKKPRHRPGETGEGKNRAGDPGGSPNAIYSAMRVPVISIYIYQLIRRNIELPTVPKVLPNSDGINPGIRHLTDHKPVFLSPEDDNFDFGEEMRAEG